MEITITIDDKMLPLIMRAYGVGTDSMGKVMDEKEMETELISRIQERLYSAVHCLKQADAAKIVTKSTELVASLSASSIKIDV